MAGLMNKRIKKNGKFIALDVTVGACATNHSYGDQLRKIREEVREVNDAIVNYCMTVDSGKDAQSVGAKWDVLEECCDAVTAVFTLMNMLGFDSWNICEVMEEVRKKNLKRGYLS